MWLSRQPDRNVTQINVLTNGLKLWNRDVPNLMDTQLERAMTNLENKTRQLVEMQGFIGFDDHTVRHLDYALRVSPVICLTLTAIATANESVLLLWILLPFAVAGAVLRNHPFDVIYNYGIRYLTGGPTIPRYPMPRRFACMMASGWILAEALSFVHGAPLAGHILGWSLVATAAVPIITGFCVPSFLYGLIFGKPKSATVGIPS